MKYAIDRYHAGYEKEVSADEFYGDWIPLRYSRFYCPECGETVYWRNSGGTHPAHFYHKEKTESSPECDKRVDGRSELYLYERVGLPLYLTKKGNIFLLNIGFPAIGENALERAAKTNTYLTISDSHHSRVAYVNHINFFSDSITLLPVDFVPLNGKNYSIKIESSSAELKKKWSNYADGFSFFGAVFSYTETGGKKIRRGDSISPDNQYYVITPKAFLPSYSSIKTEYEGKVTLNNIAYNVYKMRISVSLSDEKEYSNVSRYIKSQFGVWLLATPPELIPLWPPVISRDVMIPVSASSKLYCSVSSGNDSPNVYSYHENNVVNVPVNENEQVSKTISVSLYSSSAILSVDRKYVGREISFVRRNIERTVFSYNFSLETKNGTKVSFEGLTKKDLSADVKVKSNAKFELYVGSADKTYQHLSIRNNETELPPRRGSAEVFMVVERGIIRHYLCQGNVSETADERFLVTALHKSAIGEYHLAPSWISGFLAECRRKNYHQLSLSIIRFIRNGKLPIGAIQYLAKIKHLL